MDGLSETELLIVSYVQSHTPEDCMLDKISLGTGKSRATVLKYLETLHAREILDYRHIGRNKLWMLKDAPGVSKSIVEQTETTSVDLRPLAMLAFELQDVRYREDELMEGLERPDTIVLVTTGDMKIVASNSLARSLFPGAVSFRDLVHPSQAVRLERSLRSLKPGDASSAELDLREKTGVYRAYHTTLFSREHTHGTRNLAIVGEDLSGMKKTRRQQDALLYIIRTAGSAATGRELLESTMKGVREKLLPYVAGLVFTAEMGVAYSTSDVPAGLMDSLKQLAARSMSSMESVTMTTDGYAGPVARAGGRSPAMNCLAVPLIRDESAKGAILLLLDADVSAADVENLEIVADEVSSGLKMLRMSRERMEHLNTLVALSKVSGIVNGTRDESSMLEQTIAATMDALGFEMGCIYLKDEGNEMALRVHRNMPESLQGMCLSGAFRSLFERAFAEHSIVYITAGSAEYEALDRNIRNNGIRTLLILPVRIGEDVVGLLNMGSREEKSYSGNSLENISTIGLQLGLALDRSKLALALQPNKDLS